MRLSAGSWPSIRNALVEGTIVSLVVAAALTGATMKVDDRRSNREQLQAREEQWRTLLVSGAEYPRAVLRGLDLSGLYAPGASLVAADLSGTNLMNAGLVAARLDGVRAEKANFSGAQLNDAVLAGAVLKGSNFKNAVLKGADLRSAQLPDANLSNANLFHADLRGVDLKTADLSEVDTRYICFDESTIWPHDKKPTSSFCEADQTPTPVAGTQMTIDLSMIDDLKPTGQAQLYTKDLSMRDNRVLLVAQIENLGVVPLLGIAVVAEMPAGITVVPGSVKLRNGNYPDGYAFSDNAIQGSQVNVNIGDYNSGINAFLEMELDVSTTICGTRFLVKVFATPRRFGSIFDQVSIRRAC